MNLKELEILNHQACNFAVKLTCMIIRGNADKKLKRVEQKAQIRANRRHDKMMCEFWRG